MAVISKGIELMLQIPLQEGGYDKITLTNLQEIPELGGSTDSIEITTLADGAHKYTDGIKNYGDSVDFKFLYDWAQFKQLNDVSGKEVSWAVMLPGGEECDFSGIPSVKLDGVGVNAALTYTLSVRPTTELVFAKYDRG